MMSYRQLKGCVFMAPFSEERATQRKLIGCISSEVQGYLSDSLIFFFLRYNNTKCLFLVPDTFTHNLKGHLNVCFIPKHLGFF